MGRKPKDESEPQKDIETEKNKDSRTELLKEFMKTMGKDKNFEIFSQSKLTIIDGYISTGSFSMNKIISGSYLKGIPHGRITGLCGKKGVGKSYVCGNALREAQKLGYLCFVFESESSLDRDFLTRLGVNIDELGFRSVSTANEFKNLTLNMLETLHKMDPNQKIFIVLDSMGNLATEKEMDDAREEHNASDMGLRAKQLKSAARVLAQAVAYNNACMLITNHTYDQPVNPQNPKLGNVEIFSGGEGFNYVCSIIINLKKSIKKEEVTNSSGETEKVPTHFVIKGTTTKCRLVPEGSVSETLVSYKNGLHKWYGLLDDALQYGFMEKSGTRIVVKHLDKSFFETQLYKADNANIWETILPELDKKVQEAMAFSSVLDADEVLDDLANGEEKKEENSDK